MLSNFAFNCNLRPCNKVPYFCLPANKLKAGTHTLTVVPTFRLHLTHFLWDELGGVSVTKPTKRLRLWIRKWSRGLEV